MVVEQAHVLLDREMERVARSWWLNCCQPTRPWSSALSAPQYMQAGSSWAAEDQFHPVHPQAQACAGRSCNSVAPAPSDNIQRRNPFQKPVRAAFSSCTLFSTSLSKLRACKPVTSLRPPQWHGARPHQPD